MTNFSPALIGMPTLIGWPVTSPQTMRADPIGQIIVALALSLATSAHASQNRGVEVNAMSASYCPEPDSRLAGLVAQPARHPAVNHRVYIESSCGISLRSTFANAEELSLDDIDLFALG